MTRRVLVGKLANLLVSFQSAHAMALPEIDVPFPPYRLSGVVYGCLLNHRPALAALGEAVNAAPYKAAPKAPVLYVKPRNTLAGDGATVCVPTDATELELGAALGLVIGRTACRVDPAVARRQIVPGSARRVALSAAPSSKVAAARRPACRAAG